MPSKDDNKRSGRYQKPKFSKSRGKQPRKELKPRRDPIELDRRTILDNINSEPEWVNKLAINPIPTLILNGTPVTVLAIVKDIIGLTYPHALHTLAEKTAFSNLKLKQLMKYEDVEIPENAGEQSQRDVTFFSQLQNVHQIVERGGTKYLWGVREQIIELMRSQGEDGRFPMYYQHHARACRLLMKLGMSGNRLIDRGISWIVQRQRKDGGWLHRGNVPKGKSYDKMPSCIWTTAEVAMLLAERSAFSRSDELKRACEFLLDRLEQPNTSTLFPHADAWNIFTVSADSTGMFSGGSLKVLDILSRAGYTPADTRFKKLYSWLISVQMDNGMFPRVVSKMPIADESITLRVLSIIKRVEATR